MTLTATGSARGERADASRRLVSEVAGHVAIALHEHRSWAARAGVRVPTEIAVVESLCVSVARSRQESSLFEDLVDLRDAEQVTKRLLTREQAAEALACSTRTVDRAIADGSLSAVRLGAAGVRVRPDDLDGFVANLTGVKEGAS